MCHTSPLAWLQEGKKGHRGQGEVAGDLCGSALSWLSEAQGDRGLPASSFHMLLSGVLPLTIIPSVPNESCGPHTVPWVPEGNGSGIFRTDNGHSPHLRGAPRLSPHPV